MAKYMFLSTDAFSKGPRQWEKEKQFEPQYVKDAPNLKFIRRPYRGIQIKEDTYSTLSIRKPDGTYINLVSSSSNSGDYGVTGLYADYILQRVDDQRSEKQQVIETFGDPFVYFYGERPRVVTFSGVLISSEDFNWRSQFWKNYDESFRGTKLVEQNARAYISYDTIIIEGYPLAASATDSADDPHVIPFSIQMFVTGYYDWSNIGSTRFPGKNSYVDIDVLNEELAKSRGTYVSTTTEVRTLNMSAGPAGSKWMAALRKGGKAWNSAVSSVGSFIDQAQSVVGGRLVRVPLGASGYYASIGSPTFAAGSTDFADITAFSAMTGLPTDYEAASKILMPAYAKYSTPWTNKDGDPVGFIYENSDEYASVEPMPEGPSKRNLGNTTLASIKEDAAKRVAAAEARQAELLKYNVQSTFGAIAGGIAEGISFAKSAFGMVMTVSAYADMAIDAVANEDILNSVKASLGMKSFSFTGMFDSPFNTFKSHWDDLITVGDNPSGGIQASPSTFAEGPTSKYSASARKDKLDALGVTTEAINMDQLWLGSKGLQTYQSALESGSEMDMGEVYTQGTYQQSSASSSAGYVPQSEEEYSKSYEEAYSSNDYTVQATADPVLRKSLNEAYGDADLTYAAGEESIYTSSEEERQSEDSLEEATAAAYASTGVYSTSGSTVEKALSAAGSSLKEAVEKTYTVGKKSLARTTPEERLALYLRLTGSSPPNPEDTPNLRGSADEDSEIPPVL